jgi:hypothetical protein
LAVYDKIILRLRLHGGERKQVTELLQGLEGGGEEKEERRSKRRGEERRRGAFVVRRCESVVSAYSRVVL